MKTANIRYPLQESIARWLKILPQNLPDLKGREVFLCPSFEKADCMQWDCSCESSQLACSDFHYILLKETFDLLST